MNLWGVLTGAGDISPCYQVSGKDRVFRLSGVGVFGYTNNLSLTFCIVVLLWSGVNREPRYRFYGLEDLLCVAGHLAKWVEFSRCFPHSLQSAVFCGRRGEAISRARSPVGDVFEV